MILPSHCRYDPAAEPDQSQSASTKNHMIWIKGKKNTSSPAKWYYLELITCAPQHHVGRLHVEVDDAVVVDVVETLG